MRSTLTNAMKRFDLPRLIARTARSIPSSWSKAGDDLRREQGHAQRLQRRATAIQTYLSKHSVYKLQIGAGTNPLAGWLNTDLEPLNDGVLYLNALEPFPFQDKTFDYIFTEHMIEHITYKDGLYMLNQCFRVLKSGGRIRVATPDVRRIAALLSEEKDAGQEAYLAWSSDHLGLYSAEKTEFQRRRAEWDLDHRHFQRFFPDKSRDPACFIVNNFFRSYGHQFLYDPATLQAALKQAGFQQVIQYKPGHSEDEHLCNIESHHQLIGDENNHFETLVLEAVRP